MTDGVDYCKICFHTKDAHDIGNGLSYRKCSTDGCACNAYVYGETRVTSSTGASKGTKEARYDLIPVPALDYLARLYGKGAEKYAAHNWRLGYDWSKSYAAAQRHMNAFWSGENIDPETQVPHVINAAFHMFALATYISEHPEFDDRFETRDSRSDADPEEKVDKFYIVKAKLKSGAIVDRAFFTSMWNAQVAVEELWDKEKAADFSNVESFEIVEGIFKDA